MDKSPEIFNKREVAEERDRRVGGGLHLRVSPFSVPGRNMFSFTR